ncbi:MAG: hypothetical protein ABIA78_03145 [archaeon]
MNFIKKVFDEKPDDLVHLQFQKFSKGEFTNRALVEVKSQAGGKYTIKTSAEFANGLVRDVAEKLGEGKTKVTGAIISTADLTGELEFKDKKQFQGVKRYLIDSEMSGSEIIGLLDKFPKNFFALTFEAGDCKLKTKPKAPKSGKPGKEKDGGPKADFCNLKTGDIDIVRSFIFDTPKGTSKSNFKQAEVRHTFFIDEIIPPDGETDFAKIREVAKRKGRILREAVIDGVSSEKTVEFIA